MMRAASDCDGALLEAIHRAAFGRVLGWRAEFLIAQLAVSGTFGIIHDGGGFLLARCILDQAEVLTIAVRPAVQGRGIGSELLGLTLCRAVELGGRTLFLEVSERNLPAQALYLAHGFQQFGRRPSYYEDGAAALVMKKELANDL